MKVWEGLEFLDRVEKKVKGGSYVQPITFPTHRVELEETRVSQIYHVDLDSDPQPVTDYPPVYGDPGLGKTMFHELKPDAAQVMDKFDSLIEQLKGLKF